MKKNLIFSAVALLFLWAAWGIAYLVVRNDYILPSVGATFAALWRLLCEAAFWRAVGGTLLRTLGAFALSFLLSAGLALLASLKTWVRSFLSPVISVLRTVPTMAVILILLLWTSPAVAPILVSLLVLMPAFYAAALAGLDEAAQYAPLVRAFRVPVLRKAFRMYLPLAAPVVLSQAGSIFSMGLKITVSGEVLASTFRSLGGMMHDAQAYLDIPKLLALTIVTVLIGFLLEGICFALSKLLVRWRQ